MSPDLEQVLRATLHDAADTIEPDSAGALATIERRVTSEPAARRPWVSAGTVTAVAAGAVLLAGTALVLRHTPPARVRVGGTPHGTSREVPQPRSDTTSSTLPGPQAGAQPGGPHAVVIAAAPASDGVFAVSADSAPSATVFVTRYDAPRRLARTGPAIAFPATAAAADGDRLFLVSASRPELVEVDGTTLQSNDTTSLPEPAESIAASSDGTLWLGGRHWLVHVRLSTPSFALERFAVAGPVVSIATSPDAGTIYDLRNEAQVVEARRAGTGAEYATHAFNGPGSGSLAAFDSGVWVAYPTGTLGSVDRLSGPGLQVSAHADMPAGQGGSNGMTVVNGMGLLWIHDRITGSVVCADPASGAVREIVRRARTSTPPGVLAVGAADAYFVTGSGIEVLTPPPACR